MIGHRTIARRLRVLPLAVLAFGLLTLLADPGGVMTALRLKGVDLLQRLAPPSADGERPVPRALAVEIDAEALAAGGPWPWPRWRLAEVVERISAQDPALIVFAPVLPFPDPASPEEALRGFQPGPATTLLEQALPYVRGHDSVLAQTLAEHRAIVAFGVGGEVPEPARIAPPARLEALFPRDNPVTMVHEWPFAVRSMPLAAQRRERMGAAVLAPDRDGLLRRVPLLVSVGGALQPGLVLQAARVAADAESAEILALRTGRNPFTGRRGEVSAVSMAGRTLPTAPDAGLWLAFRKDEAPYTLSAAALADPGLQPWRLKDKIVVIGLGVAAGDPAYTVPGGGTMGAAEAYARALDQIVTGTFLRRTQAQAGLELAALIGFGLLLALAAVLLPVPVSLGLCVLTVGGGVLLARSAFIEAGTLFDPLGPSAVLALTVLSGAGVRIYGVLAAQRHLRAALRGKVPGSVVRAAARDPSEGGFSGDRRKGTVLIAGLRDFDAITETLIEDPEGVRILLTEFSSWAHAHVRRSRGTLDRLAGPRVTAFWNAPGDDMDHALHACDCAMRMIEGLDELNRRILVQGQRRHRELPPLQVEIAVNTGQCFVGEFGSVARPDYSLVGEVTGTAERMVRESGRYGPAILVGEHTANAVRNLFALLEIDRFDSPHKPLPMRVYALMGNPLVRASPRFRSIEQKHQEIFEALLARDWDKAEALVEEARDLRGAVPGLYDLYRRRIAHWRAEPPPEGWDGVFRTRLA
ncbi:MAG: adenylate/guanylate cyclase domain-containing protein [Alphaproteobacteria bacterium]|nr:adenylate/guanylate cyclase domain-containing protein [Alphaproteobacteria bacterium]